jgi:hypothetical protein
LGREWLGECGCFDIRWNGSQRLGIRYDEAARLRLERICIGREIDFARHLSSADALQQEITQRLNWCRDGNLHFTDQNMWKEIDQGNAEALRHLGTPAWVIALIFRVRDLSYRIRRFTRRIVGASTR